MKLKLNTKLNDRQRLQALAALRNRAMDSKQEFPAASSAVEAQFKPLLTRVAALEKTARDREKERSARVDLEQTPFDAETYLISLEQFAKRVPESSLAQNLETLRKEQPLWEGLLSWSTFYDELFSSKLKASYQEAEQALARGDELLEKYANIAAAQDYQKRRAYLSSVASRSAKGENALISKFEKLMRDPLVANLWMIENTDGQRYYLRAKPELVSGTYKFKYLAGFDLSEKVRTMRETETAYLDKAPQTIFAEYAIARLGELSDKGWEATFAALIQKVNATEPKPIEPILRLALLKRLLATGAAGSTVMEEGFQKYRSAVEDANVDLAVAWMQPRDQQAREERSRAELLIGNFPSYENALMKTSRLYKEMIKPPPHRYLSYGWLSREMDGQWQVRSSTETRSNGDLVVILPMPGEKQAKLIKIGTLQAGVARLGTLGSQARDDGRPVFLRTSRGS